MTSYAILRNSGESTPFVQVHAETMSLPSLRSFTVTDLPAVGTVVQFKIEATNRGGFSNTSYETLTVVIADVPATPIDAPVSDILSTNSLQIVISFDEPASGGSVLTNYEVLIDDGLGGGFVTAVGGSLNTYL